jgi:hypothetical protein
MASLKVWLAIGFLLVCSTRLPALSIVQESVLGGSLYQQGNGGVSGGGTWTFLASRFAPGLGTLESVLFEARVHASLSSTEYNPFNFALDHTPGVLYSTTVYLYGFGNEVLGPQSVALFGDSMTLASGAAHTFTAEVDQYFSHSVAASLLGNYVGEGTGGILVNPSFFGFNQYLGGSANITIDARLTYLYSEAKEDGTAVPDTGSTIALLASGLLFLGAACVRLR